MAERVADRLAAILFAATEIGDMIALGESPAGLEAVRAAVEEIRRSLAFWSLNSP